MISRQAELELRVRERPDDIDARRELATLFYRGGERARAAAELAPVVEFHTRGGNGAEALRVARIVLWLDAENIHHRMLMARVHARFPGVESSRAAEPIEEVITLGPSERVEEIEFTDSLEMQAVGVVEPVAAPDEEDDDEATAPVDHLIQAAAAAESAVADEDTGEYEVEAGDVVSDDFVDDDRDGADEATPSRITPKGVAVDAFPDEEVTYTTASARAMADASASAHDLAEAARNSIERRRRQLERLRTGTPADRVDLGPAPEHATLRDVPPNELFERLADDVVARVFESMRYVEYATGTSVVEAEEPLERLVVVLSGHCSVSGGSGEARFGPGATLCALELLSWTEPDLPVVASEPVTTLELEAGALAGLRALEPEVNDALSALLRDLLLRALLTESPLFDGLPFSLLEALSERFFALDLDAGESVIRAGDICRRLLLVQTGELAIEERRSSGVDRLTLRPGDFFGFVGTILGRPATVNVNATAPSTVLVLPEQEVYKLVADCPSVARAAREEAADRDELAISVHSVGRVGGLQVFRKI